MNERMGEKRNQPPPPGETQFTRSQLQRMLGISERQLSAWERQGWIQPSHVLPHSESPDRRKPDGPSRGKPKEGSRYSFSDLVALKTLLRLRQSGVAPDRLRLVHTALRERLAAAGVTRPWTQLPIYSEGKRLSVYFQGARMEPLTGQLLLDYAPGRQGQKIRSLEPAERRRQRPETDRLALAERFFLAGLRHEARAATLPKAIRAYQKAVEANPRAIGAYINLGTIYYNLGRLNEAENCYRAALSIHPHSALVHFNLGNLFDEKAQWEEARESYEEAIRLDPNYPDPRYNLALVYERLGRHGKASQQWRGYLKLDAQSHWASFARQKLEQLPFRVLSPRPSSREGP